MTDPAWHPDPMHRHQLRWWDGTQWSDQVSDNGVTTADPLHGGATVPADATIGAAPSGRPIKVFVIVGAAVALLVVVLVLAVVVASDDGGSGGGSAQDGGECALLTTAEVTDAIGQPFAEGESVEESGTPGCRWESTEPPSEQVNGAMNLEVFVFDLTAADRTAFDDLEADPDNEILDIGDRAILECSFEPDFGDICDTWGSVFAISGEQYIEVDLGNFAWPEDITQEELRLALIDLGEAAIDRLGDQPSAGS